MTKKQKLELTWVGKENRPRLEPRILIEDPAKSYHAAARVSDEDIFDNVLIHGDNLLALKALEADYAGKVKCVFIDPPYNTGSAFAQYDDGLEHSIWLGLMRDRLEIIRRLLSDDGSLWITIDDNEAHYLKVLCDEVFGRTNFVANVVWKKKYTVSNDAKWFSDNHDHILIFAANKEGWRPNKLPRSDEMNARYANPDHHPKGPWKATPLHAKSGSEKAQKFTFTFKNGYVWSAPPGTFPRFSEDTLRRYDEGNEIWFGRDGTAQPSRKTFLSELTNDGTPPLTVWLNDEVGHNHEAKTEAKEFNSTDVFATPKPERLLNRILHIATNPGDLVFDSFAGSGTTGAVAHKMGRRWIMVELGDHCTSHIVPRLQKVIDGSDQGGVSKAIDWKGGGGFRYYELAPSLLEKDKWGREVISTEYDASMLAQALCKLEGFTYAPSDSVYWQQGHSSETDFLYVTTQTLGPEELASLSEEVGDGRSLLILCAAFRGNADLWPNLTLRKIPNHIRSKCEWGHDDYSLNVANLPMARSATSPSQPAQSSLFDGEDVA
jgi:adenine-specific DNA-methyltransferase